MVDLALTFVSWNLAMLARSDQAPPSWGQEHTEAEVRRVALDVRPDLVLFQELPRLVPYLETHDMVRANPESHQGNLATLVSHELVARLGPPDVTTVPGCAILTTFGTPAASAASDPPATAAASADSEGRASAPGPSITIANVHLAPGTGAAAVSARLDQLARVVEASPTAAIAIVGDTNTRVDELGALADADLSSPRPPRPTWDSRANRFHRRSPEFIAFFTRVIVSPGLHVTDQAVLDEPVDIDGNRFHLSDHFALTGTLVVSATA